MESMYHQWPGLILDPNYEKELLDLCVVVLNYLDLILVSGTGTSTSWAEIRIHERFIATADDKCRGFRVTILEELFMGDLSNSDLDQEEGSDDKLIVSAGLKRTMRDFEDEEEVDLSGGTADRIQAVAKVAKRVKI